VLGSGEDSDDEPTWSAMPGRGGAKGKKKKDDEEKSETESYMLFDFRRGPSQWPNCVEVINSEKGAEMTEKAKEEILKKGKKGKGGDDSAFFSDSSSDDDFGSDDEEAAESTAPPDAEFETLRDGSTAYVLPPGSRIKLDLRDILKGGDSKKEERKKEAAKKKKWKESNKGGGGIPGFFGGGGIMMGGGGGKYAKKWKEYVNVYTITMDMKVLDELPADGVALYQVQHSTRHYTTRHDTTRHDTARHYTLIRYTYIVCASPSDRVDSYRRIRQNRPDAPEVL
jgi:hypothetical protein